MSKPYDATMKEMVGTRPADWLALLDGAAPAAPVEVLNVDLSTVSAATDVLLRCGGLVRHLDFEVGWDRSRGRKFLRYNVLAYERYAVPVHSTLLLLHPKADHSSLTGLLRYETFGGRGCVEFRYDVVRVWRIPVAQVLNGGVATLPLAPLARMPGRRPLRRTLPGVIEKVVTRLHEELPRPEAAVLTQAAYVLTGLRVTRGVLVELFERVSTMFRESSAYQLILEEGAVNGVRRTLLLQGREKFGKPSPEDETAVQSITDIKRLEQLSRRLLRVDSWQELLATR